MGLNLDSLVGKTADVSVVFMGQTANVTYDPTYLTSETMLAMRKDEDFNKLFVELVKDWDVTRSDQKVELTVENMKGIPLMFLRAIYMAVMADVGDGSAGKASSAG